jgi:hypothetical protein
LRQFLINFSVDAELFWQSNDVVKSKTVNCESGNYQSFYIQMATAIVSADQSVPVDPAQALENIRIIEKIAGKQ